VDSAYREAALRYLDLRFCRLETLLGTDDDTEELAAAQARAIAAAEQDALAGGVTLPIEWLRRRTQIPALAEECLLLAVAAQVRPGFAGVVARHPAASGFAHVSPELCLSVFLPDRIDRLAHMPLFLPGSGLLRHRLARVLPSPDASADVLRGILVPSPVVTAALLAVESLPDILEGVAARVQPEVALGDVVLSDDVRARCDAALARLRGSDALDPARFGPGGYDLPAAFVELVTGPEGSGRRLLATALAREAGATLLSLDCRALAQRPRLEQEACLELAFQIALLRGDWLLATNAEAALGDGGVASHLAHLARASPITCLLTASSAAALAPEVRRLVCGHLQLSRPDHRLMEQVWRRHLAAAPAPVDADWPRLVERNPIPPIGVRNAMRSAARAAAAPDADALSAAAAAVAQATADGHAIKMPARRRLSDIFLEEELAAELTQIIGIAKTRHLAIREWGLGERIQRGLGLVCLFQGESGTGKTLAAEVIAAEVGLPLMRVNLATVVSKYIGETAKNLHDLFEQAAHSPCVLLFDEADSLFAKRTEVSRSTDRYANMDVNLLLQLTEDHDGIVLLSTNLAASIDKAFRRRINFNLRFEPPDADIRRAIWRHLMPPGVPQADLDLDALADRHELTGGAIKSIIVRAVFEAARTGEPVTGPTIERAITHELTSQGKVVQSL
jgi:AAA+ superfamily predicted ATPase